MTATSKSTRVSIDSGLPEDRKDWPAGVLDKMTQFTQGSVVEYPPFFYYADPQRPVWSRTFEYTEGSSGPEVVEVAGDFSPRYGLITTQTCDLVEEAPHRAFRPWVQICPVEDRSDLNSGNRKLLEKGHGSLHLLYLPALPDGFWVADLRIELPIEKGWLANQTALRGFNSEPDQLQVGLRIAKIRSRPAFSKQFVESVQKPLAEKLKAMRTDNRQLLGDINEQVEELAIQTDSLLDPKYVQILLITNGELSDNVEQWWRAWWDEASEAAFKAGIRLHQLTIRRDSEIRLSEFKRMQFLPLDRVSPR